MPTPETSSLGIALSLATAVCWAISPMCFASAGRHIGSFRVLLLRSLLASLVLLLLLPLYLLAAHPALPGKTQFCYLIVSGFAGMAAGDAFYYEALVLLGPRRATQLQVLTPITTVLIAWLALGEFLKPLNLAGIALTLGATSYAVLARRRATEADAPHDPGRVSLPGLACAVGGTICVAVGAVIGRQAFRMAPLDPFVAAVIRVASTGIILWLGTALTGHAPAVLSHLRSRFVLSRVGPGTLAGPVLGMVCYVIALKNLQVGLVSTLTAMSPLFILPLIAFRYRTRFGPDIIVASGAACLGVWLICQ